MNIARYIAQRYLVSPSDQNAVNIINRVTFLVIVIGAAALFIVLSAFAGLKEFSLSFTNSFDPDLKATAAQGKYFKLTPSRRDSLNSIEGLAHYSLEIEERIFLTHKNRNHVAYIKAVDSNYLRVTPMEDLMYFGSWFQDDPYQVVTGIGTANLLGVGVNDYRNLLQILAPKPGEGPVSGTSKPYNQLAVTVSGVYAINEELDRKYVFAPLETVQPLLEKSEEDITAINFRLQPGASEEAVRKAIGEVFDNTLLLRNRAQLNDALYKMLNTENLAIYLIFTLVLIIALFNVVGAIIMMILDKQGNLKTLFSLGVPMFRLRNVYFYLGVMVTALGGVIGIALASLLVWTQLEFQWIRLTPSLAYPVQFSWFNVMVVLLTILVLGIIASRIASSRITAKLLK